ncbi:MAG: HMA2 domain-containing protein [Desulfobacteraceae bacterium]
MLPEAHICHQLSTRVRIRVPSKRGDTDFFDAAAQRLVRIKGSERVQANPATGSILITGKAIDAEKITGVAHEEGLFDMVSAQAETVPLAQRLVEPFRDTSAALSRFTKGELDLPGLVFLVLLGTGLYQLARGNFRTPPWYTAFWYALGVLTKSLTDKK